MTSSIFFNWLLKSSSGNRLRATKLQNTFGCIMAHEKHICHAKNLLCLSSIFQFPKWVKPKASPNLVGSWESIKENKQNAYWTSASLRSGLTLAWEFPSNSACFSIDRLRELHQSWNRKEGEIGSDTGSCSSPYNSPSTWNVLLKEFFRKALFFFLYCSLATSVL